MATLQDLLASFTGGNDTNPTGGATAGYTPQASPGMGGGVSPLAQALLAGYFRAISSPKLQGWAGALGHGGLQALDTYSGAIDQQQKNALEQSRQQMLAAQ